MFLKVGTNNWASFPKRMRFLSGFFWSYMPSKNILTSPIAVTKFFNNTRSLRRQWSSSSHSTNQTLYEVIHRLWNDSKLQGR